MNFRLTITTILLYSPVTRFATVLQGIKLDEFTFHNA